MKRGGSLDNTLYYVVLIVAILNIIAYASVQDWKSIGCFVLAGVAMTVFNKNKTVILIVAILSAAVCRNVYIEGMTKKKDKLDELKDLMKGANLEGLKLSGKASSLAKKQKDLFHMAKKLEPMMQQASKMMAGLPEGFLEKAMQNFNNQTN
jgi:hypothetical protein